MIAAVRLKQAISSFFKMLRVALSICKTTRVLPLMSRRELRHPHVMGQIILLSRVISHELSFMSVPLVDSRPFLGGGSRLDLAYEVPGSCGAVVSIVWSVL